MLHVETIRRGADNSESEVRMADGLSTFACPRGRDERETAFNRFDDSEVWDCFTSSPIVARNLRKRGWEPDPTWHGEGQRFFLPLGAIKVRSRKEMESAKKRAAGTGFAKKAGDYPPVGGE